jgi:UDP-N-acetylglucosamine acyltransferase
VIHPSAIIDKSAEIGRNVTIGPFCSIGAEVKIADYTTLKSHVAIDGNTRIGRNTTIYSFASIGGSPQDLKYTGEKSELVIGENNVIREYVTIHPGTKQGGMITQIGDDCLFMVGSHVAHDCKIGNHVILANYVSLAGHVHIGDYAIIGGLSAVLQYVRIGNHAMIGGMSGVDKDVIPFGLAKSERATLAGLNLVGMKRRGFDLRQTLECAAAIEDLFGSSETFDKRLRSTIAKYPENPILKQIIQFIEQDRSRSYCTPK